MINERGLSLIREFEGLRLEAYPDPATSGDPYTIGYGCTHGVTPGMVITLEQANAWLDRDAKDVADEVSLVVSPSLTDNQFAACVCFAYNVKGWRETPLFGFLEKGYTGIASQHWLLYDKAAGVPMAGLERRRQAELALFQSGTGE